MRLRSVLVALAVLAPVVVALAAEPPADAASSAAVYVTSPAASTVRLRVSEGPGADCDSYLNVMRFDGQIRSGETLRVPIAGPCVCVSSTSTGFPDSDWSLGARYCPPRAAFSKRPVATSSFAINLDGR